MPRIKIEDDNQNWLNWGNLVLAWIGGAERPTTVGELKVQLSEKRVEAEVEGPDTRKVQIWQYEDGSDKPLVIYIPSQAMLKAKLKLIGDEPGPYPYSLMPLFYNTAYAEARRADLSVAEKHALAIRRVGEYTVNECC